VDILIFFFVVILKKKGPKIIFFTEDISLGLFSTISLSFFTFRLLDRHH